MFDALKRTLFGPGQERGSGPTDTELLERWETNHIAGRRIVTFQPASTEAIAGVVLFLHGHGGRLLNQNLSYTRLFQEYNLAAVCPDGGQSWWLDVVSPDFDDQQTPQQWLLQQVVPWIRDRFATVPPRIALLGVSMGGQGALQLAYRHATQFPVVAAVAPAVDFDQLYGAGIPLDRMFPDREAARQATVVLNLHPLSWPRHQWFCCDPADTEWYDGAARLGMKLSSSGILHERDLQTTGGGHSWEYFDRMARPAIQQIVNGLRAV